MTSAERKQYFEDHYPEAAYLEASTDNLHEYLMGIEWLEPGEKIALLEKPGEGNMNFVVRVITNHERSFIVKQSRPWVEKYPSIAAPIERIQMEIQYYGAIEKDDLLQSHSPAIYVNHPESYIMIMQDLGSVQDLTYLYQKGEQLPLDILHQIMNYIDALHALAVSDFPDNKAMRRLNHAHIFVIPFQPDNGINLDGIHDGLTEVAKPYQNDDQLRQHVSELGDLYLGEGSTLLHGDYYPGSMMELDGDIKIIDPEFSFLGPAEFDLGIFCAHLHFAQQHQAMIKAFVESRSNVDIQLIGAFAGVEILRRLIGVAQLPLDLSLEEKQELMRKARNWIVGEQQIVS